MAQLIGTAASTTKDFLGVSNTVTIDNFTFKLFYKATTTILMLGAAITSSKQFFGDPIVCELVINMFSIIRLLILFDEI